MTLPTYEEAYAKARQKTAFSNSDEGLGWMAAWCDRCVHDLPARRDDPGNGCPLVLVALTDRTPVEWLDNTQIGPDGLLMPYSRAGQYSCVMFRPEDDPGPDEPTPIPDIPGQECLFARDGWERPARMFADTKPQEVPA